MPVQRLHESSAAIVRQIYFGASTSLAHTNFDYSPRSPAQAVVEVARCPSFTMFTGIAMHSNSLESNAPKIAPTQATEHKARTRSGRRGELSERETLEQKLRTTNQLLQSVADAQLDYAAGKSLDQVLGRLFQTLLHTTKARQGYLAELAAPDLVHDLMQVRVYAGHIDSAQFDAELTTVASLVAREGRVITYHPANQPTTDAQLIQDSSSYYIGLPITLPAVAHNETEQLDLADGSLPLGIVVISGRADLFDPDILVMVKPFVATCAQFIMAHRNNLKRMATDAALVEARTLFEQQIAIRAADFERAVRARDEFMATMNHEMRTPLHAVLLYADSLHAQLAAPLNERQRRAVNGIRESAHHLLLLINDILDVAKMDAGKLSLNIAATEVGSICQSALLMVAEMAQKKWLELHFENQQQITHMESDARRVKQMLVNLLGNAIKFTAEGGKVGLEVRGDETANTIQFVVWDTGTGIAPEDLKLLFQPFVQLESNHLRHQTGTGLGLFIVSRMAQLHGGCVAVSSEPGRGSRFTITLPWHQRQSAPAAVLYRSVTVKTSLEG